MRACCPLNCDSGTARTPFADVRFDNAAGMITSFQRADVDRHVRPRRAGEDAHQRRRARIAFGEKDVTPDAAAPRPQARHRSPRGG